MAHPGHPRAHRRVPVYRCFADRDELVTALVRDAYRSFADTVRTAFDSGADLAGLARVPRPRRAHARLPRPDDTTATSFELTSVLLEAAAHHRRTSRPPPSTSTWKPTVKGRGGIHFAGMEFDPGLRIAEELGGG